MWPLIKTKYMNEGFATYWHELILRQLFKEHLLNDTEHSEINYSNSLVKAKNPYTMNPYLVGCEIWEDMVDRWNKGKHGREGEQIENHEDKLSFDDGSMKGREKMFRTLRTSNDWMFMNDFLTPDLVRKLKLYMYVKQKNVFFEELVVTDRKAIEIKDIIIKTFSHSGIPRVFVENGNYLDRGELNLEHEFIGVPLNPEYAQKTLQHICFLWNDKVGLKTIRNKKEFKFVANKEETIGEVFDINDLDF